MIHSRLQCWYYKTRGVHVCPNRWQPFLTGLDNRVLSAIEDDVLAPKIMEASIARAVQMLTASQGQDDGARSARAIATLDRELERLTTLAAAGGSDIPTVLEGLRTRQERRRMLTAEALRSSTQRPPVRSAREIERHCDRGSRMFAGCSGGTSSKHARCWRAYSRVALK